VVHEICDDGNDCRGPLRKNGAKGVEGGGLDFDCRG